MLGAIVGDIVGSRFEFSGLKSKDFTMFSSNCFVTDDSIMTLAVAEAILKCQGDYTKLYEYTIASMRLIGPKYPCSGYGGNFSAGFIKKNQDHIIVMVMVRRCA